MSSCVWPCPVPQKGHKAGPNARRTGPKIAASGAERRRESCVHKSCMRLRFLWADRIAGKNMIQKNWADLSGKIMRPNKEKGARLIRGEAIALYPIITVDPDLISNSPNAVLKFLQLEVAAPLLELSRAACRMPPRRRTGRAACPPRRCRFPSRPALGRENPFRDFRRLPNCRARS